MHDEFADMFDPIDNMIVGIERQMQKINEEMQMYALDKDKELTEFAKMLRLKRGCRR